MRERPLYFTVAALLVQWVMVMVGVVFRLRQPNKERLKDIRQSITRACILPLFTNRSRSPRINSLERPLGLHSLHDGGIVWPTNPQKIRLFIPKRRRKLLPQQRAQPLPGRSTGKFCAGPPSSASSSWSRFGTSPSPPIGPLVILRKRASGATR